MKPAARSSDNGASILSLMVYTIELPHCPVAPVLVDLHSHADAFPALEGLVQHRKPGQRWDQTNRTSCSLPSLRTRAVSLAAFPRTGEQRAAGPAPAVRPASSRNLPAKRHRLAWQECVRPIVPGLSRSRGVFVIHPPPQ